jgi:hypothetical protein
MPGKSANKELLLVGDLLDPHAADLSPGTPHSSTLESREN